MTDLVKTVAWSMCTEAGWLYVGQGEGATPDEEWEHDKAVWLAVAPIAIAIVLEEAVKVAMAQKNPEPPLKPNQMRFDPANNMAERIAAAIRALGDSHD